MAVTPYSTQVDLDNLNSSHSLAILSVPPASYVLDLGAADGSVARRLKERGCTVWAVELNARAAEAARQVCDQVFVGDLEGEDVWSALHGQTFDVILALDVLEHLRDPEAALKRAADHLAPEGAIIVSLPNVTHGAIRLSLLRGQFRYQETGPLDATHLRFFDRPGAEELIHSAGLAISQRLRVTRALDETEIPVTTEGVPPEVLDTIARDPEATTYQFVFVARREGPPASVAPAGAMLPERLLTDLEDLKARFSEVEQFARNLAADRERLLGETEQQRREYTQRFAAFDDTSAIHQREREELRRELERRVQEVRQRDLEVTQGKADLAVKQAFIDDLRAEHRAVQDQGRELRSELERRVEEAHQRHVEIAQCKADLVVKQAFNDDLRGEHRAIQDERDALQRYASSAGFRLVEGAISGMKRIPFVHSAARRLVRLIAGRRAPGN